MAVQNTATVTPEGVVGVLRESLAHVWDNYALPLLRDITNKDLLIKLTQKTDTLVRLLYYSMFFVDFSGALTLLSGEVQALQPLSNEVQALKILSIIVPPYLRTYDSTTKKGLAVPESCESIWDIMSNITHVCKPIAGERTTKRRGGPAVASAATLQENQQCKNALLLSLPQKKVQPNQCQIDTESQVPLPSQKEEEEE